MFQHRPGFFVAAAFALSVQAAAALADNPHAIGSSFPVCDTPDDQVNPWIIADGSQGAIVGWTNVSPTGVEIRVQHLSPSGARLWPAEGLTVGQAGLQEDWSSAIPDGDGGLFVTWERGSKNASNLSDVYAQHVDRHGQVIWAPAGMPLCTAPGTQAAPQLALDGQGGVIGTWAFDGRAGLARAYAQHLDPQGEPLWALNGIPLTSVDSGQDGTWLVSDGAGGAILAWTDRRNGQPDIYAQRLGGDGASLWSADGVPVCTEPGPEGYLLMTGDGGVGAVVVWQDGRGMTPSIYGFHVYAQHLLSDGTAAWAENGIPISTTGGYYPILGCIGDGAGGAIVEWQVPNFDGNRLLVQRVAANGTPVWPVNGALVAIASPSPVASASLASDNAHGALVGWIDVGDHSLHAQHVAADGSMIWGSAGVTLAPAAPIPRGGPTILASGGGALVCWSEYGSEANGDLIGERIQQSGKLSGPSAPNLSIARATTSSTPISEIRFELTEASEVALQIYDASGRKVRVIPPQSFPAGENRIALPTTGESGDRLRAGVYFFKLEGGSLARSGRFVVLN